MIAVFIIIVAIIKYEIDVFGSQVQKVELLALSWSRHIFIMNLCKFLFLSLGVSASTHAHTRTHCCSPITALTATSSAIVSVFVFVCVLTNCILFCMHLSLIYMSDCAICDFFLLVSTQLSLLVPVLLRRYRTVGDTWPHMPPLHAPGGQNPDGLPVSIITQA